MQIEILELLELTIETSAGSINRNAFEKWADDNEKREYEFEDSFGRDVHGITDWKDYYYGDYIEQDLAEYLQYLNGNAPANKLSLTIK